MTLLHLHDTPRRTAAAFALGVFFSFSPFLGLQILVATALAFLLGLNRLAVFAGLNANLPWFVVPWYAGTTVAAAAVLGVSLPGHFTADVAELFSLGLFSRGFWRHARTVLQPFVVPFLVGPTVGAVVLGLAAYPPTLMMLRRRASAET